MSMVNFVRWCSILLIITLTSCGGGGGGSGSDSGGVSASGGGYSIAVDKSNISFQTLSDSTPDSQVISVTYKGDGVIVGYPPGVQPPSWLIVSTGNETGNKVDITLKVVNVSFAMEGTQNTTLRFVTGKSDGSVEKHVDVPISLNVLWPYVVSISSPTYELKYTAVDGNELPAAQSFNVTANRLPLNWSVSVDYESQDDVDWLSVAESGTFDKKDNSISVAVSKASVGVHKAKLLVTDSTKVSTYTVPVEYVVTSAVQAKGLSDITITSSSTLTDLTKTFELSSLSPDSKRPSLNWMLTSDEDWVSFDVTSGNFSNSNTIKMQLNPEKMKNLPNGANTAHIKVSVTGGDIEPADFSVVVNLDLPTITSGYPHIGYAGRSESITLYGGGFSKLNNPKVLFDTTEVDAEIENDHLMHVKYPANLPAGSVNIFLKSTQVIPTGTTFTLVSPPQYKYAKVEFQGYYDNIELDPERGSILLSGSGNGDIRMLNRVADEWGSKTYSIDEANNPTLTLDGKKIVFTAGFWAHVTKLIYLDPVTFEEKNSTSLGDSVSYQALDTVAPLFDGNMFMLSTNQWPAAIMYPSLKKFEVPLIYSPVLIQSADKSLMIMGETNSNRNIYSMSAGESQFKPRTLQLEYFRKTEVVMSRDASRIVADGNVYDKTFNLLGAMENPPYMIAISPDGRTAYGYDYSGHKFSRFDLSNPTGPYPQTSADLGFVIDSSLGFYVSAMKVTDDGNALIVTATKRDNTDFNTIHAQLYVFPLN